MAATPELAELANLDARVAQLEARIARLEAAAGPTDDTSVDSDSLATRAGGKADDGADSTTRGDVFWALNELRRRAGDAGGVLWTGSVQLPDGRWAEWQEGYPTEEVLDRDWSLSADQLAALAHPMRLTLLHQVACGVNTTAELAEVEGLGTSGQLHHHLRQLVAAGWLRTTGRGRYEVPIARVIPLLVTVGGTAP